jgi:hypothetical protein
LLGGYEAGKLKSVGASEIASIQAFQLPSIPAFLITHNIATRSKDVSE